MRAPGDTNSWSTVLSGQRNNMFFPALRAGTESTSRHRVNSRFKEEPWQLIVGVRGVSPGHRQAPFDTKSPGAHSTTTHFRPPHGTSTPGKDDDLPPKLGNVCFRRHRANSYLKETPCQLIACPRGISTCRRKPPFDTKSPGAHSTTPPFPRAPGLRPP